MKKKIISILMTCLCTITSLTIPSISVSAEDIGEVTETTMINSSDIIEEQTNENICQITANISSNFSVTIPKHIILSGGNGKGDYNVTVKGDIAATEIINVIPNDSFYLSSFGKEDIEAFVSQLKNTFTYTDAMKTEDDKLVGTTTTGTIEASNLTSGVWEGSFYFNLSLEAVEEKQESGLYDENDILLASWDELVDSYGLDVESNYTDETYNTSENLLYYILNNNDAFSTASKLVIPDSVISIGDFALCNCTSLTNVMIPDSVTSLGNGAFGNCTALASIELPNSITTIGDYAFSSCTSLTNVEIPNSVTSIEEGAFYYCTSLENVTIPDSVTSIEKEAFYCCISLTSIDIPDSVTSIGDFAFSGCTALTNITVDENNTVYDSRNNCNAIIETASNTLITGCKNTVIPSSVTSIGDYAFMGCTELTSIEIPDSVTSIGVSAFYACKNLTTIYIPESVEKICAYETTGLREDEPFYNCSKDLKIYCGASEAQEGWETYWNTYSWSPTYYLSVTYNVTREEYEANYK